jgi:hypothetical protein
VTASAGPLLRDIHLPPAPGWWPPAPGWWLLAALVLALALWLMRIFWRQRQRARARATLMREFERIDRSLQDDPAARVAEYSALLRRAACRHAPQASTLRDQHWLAFLDGDDSRRSFQEGAGRLLLDGPYRLHVEREEADALAALVRARLERFATVHNV